MAHETNKSFISSLQVLVTLILQYQEHLAELEQNIDALTEEIEECDLIQSIPGNGHKIATTILPEIREIDLFDHSKKQVAFAGIEPKENRIKSLWLHVQISWFIGSIPS